jgi:G3E family GTPase
MVPVPILLVAGFLGAGKTTVVNHLLAHAEGRRIAAVVNDFGAINIDAELIVGASDGVVSLSNGCICCSLEGDLLRTLATLLRRDPRPEFIVIETSGVADPSDIVRNLMDPIIWKEAPLETVLCVVWSTRQLAQNCATRCGCCIRRRCWSMLCMARSPQRCCSLRTWIVCRRRAIRVRDGRRPTGSRR